MCWLDVFGYNCYMFSMDNTQVCVFKKANQIDLTCLLQITNSCTLEAQICFEVQSNFSHQTLEGKFANQKFSRRISNFMECHGTRPVMMTFLHPSSRGHTLMSGFVASCFLSALPPVDLWAGCLEEPWCGDLLTYLPSPSAGARWARGFVGVREQEGHCGSCKHQ